MPTLKHYLDFLWAMTEKEIKARYKHAVLGFSWAILSPLLHMLIIGFIFSLFIKIPNYYLFLLSGLLPWRFFSTSLSNTTTSFVQERSLLQKSKFPKESIPISIILSRFLQLIVSLGLLIFFLSITNKLVFPQILLLIPGLIWLLTFTVGLSLFTATLQVRYRDVNFLVQSLLLLWFYATPVLYGLALIPSRLRPIFALNPLTSIFGLFHLSILNQGIINSQIVIVNIFLTIVIVLLGVITYKKQHKYFVDWL